MLPTGFETFTMFNMTILHCYSAKMTENTEKHIRSHRILRVSTRNFYGPQSYSCDLFLFSSSSCLIQMQLLQVALGKRNCPGNVMLRFSHVLCSEGNGTLRNDSQIICNLLYPWICFFCGKMIRCCCCWLRGFLLCVDLVICILQRISMWYYLCLCLSPFCSTIARC